MYFNERCPVLKLATLLLLQFTLNLREWECEGKIYKDFRYSGNETKYNAFIVDASVGNFSKQLNGYKAIWKDFSTLLVEMRTMSDIVGFLENDALPIMESLGNETKVIVSLREGFSQALSFSDGSETFQEYASLTQAEKQIMLVTLLDRTHKALETARNVTDNRITVTGIKLLSSQWKFHDYFNKFYLDVPFSRRELKRKFKEDKYKKEMEKEDLFEPLEFAFKYFARSYPLFLETILVEDDVAFYGQLFYQYEDFVAYADGVHKRFDEIRKRIGIGTNKYQSDMIFKFVLKEVDLEIETFDRKSFERYARLLATFSFKWGFETKRRAAFTRKLKDSDFSENLTVASLPNPFKFAKITSTWFKRSVPSDEGKAKTIDLLRKEFSEIIIAIPENSSLDKMPESKFLEYFEEEAKSGIEFLVKYFAKRAISPMPISLHVKAFHKGSHGEKIRNLLITKVKQIAMVYPDSLKYLIFQPPLTPKRQLNKSVINLNLRDLKEVNIMFGAEEHLQSYLFEEMVPKNIDLLGVNKSITDLVLVSTLTSAFFDDFKRIVDVLSELRLRLQNDYNLDRHRVVVEGSWPMYKDYKNKNCFGYKTFWELMKNWAQVHGYELINGHCHICDRNIRGDRLALGWFKEYYEDGFENVEMDDGFLSYYKDICVVIDTEKPPINFQFPKNLFGVTVDLTREEFRTLSSKQTVRWLQLVHLKFNRIEIVQRNKGGMTIPIDRIEEILDTLKSRYDGNILLNSFNYYINAGDIDGFNNFLTDSKRIPINFKHRIISGVHFELPQNYIVNEEKVRKVEKILVSKANLRTPIGLSIKFEGYPKLPQSISKLISLADYIILDVDLPDLFVQLDILLMFTSADTTYLRKTTVNNTAQVISDLRNLNTRLVIDNLRALRYYINWLNKNITVHARVKWPTLEGNPGTSENYLKVWSFVNDISTSFGFPVFVYEAFDGKKPHGNGNRNYGWWQIGNYSDMDDASISSVVEKQADYFRKDTLKPTIEPEPILTTGISIEYIVVGLILGILLTALLVVALIMQLRKQGRILSKQEAERFRQGFKEHELQDDTEKLIFGRRYDGEKYEIEKGNFDVDSSTWIGGGNFGVVYKTKLKKYCNYVAVKVPKELSPLELHSCINTFLDEIKIMSYVGRHINILQFLGAFTKEIENGVVYIVTEYCELGSLLHELRSMRIGGTMNNFEYELYRFCQDISCGMDYLFQKKVIHGDLSTRNVLLNSDRTCKISDFGLARKLEQYEIYIKRKEEDPLPWRWMALEAMQFGKFTLKSDIWSIGVTIWEIFSLGEQPYAGMRYSAEFIDYIQQGRRLQKPEKASENIYRQMEACWNANMSLRPTTGELIELFRNLRGNEYSLL